MLHKSVFMRTNAKLATIKNGDLAGVVPVGVTVTS